MRLLNIIIHLLAALVAVESTVMAIVFVGGASGPHLWLVRFAGACLFVVAVAHVLPFRSLPARVHVIGYLALTVATAWSFGALYYFAEADDPFRARGMFFSDAPFRLACFLCILPALRAALRLIAMTSELHAASNHAATR